MKRVRDTSGSYIIEDFIGEGGFAQVYLATTEEGNKKYAIKSIAKRKGIQQSVSREVIAGRKLRHPNLVDFVDFEETNSSYNLICDYIEGSFHFNSYCFLI